MSPTWKDRLAVLSLYLTAIFLGVVWWAASARADVTSTNERQFVEVVHQLGFQSPGGTSQELGFGYAVCSYIDAGLTPHEAGTKLVKLSLLSQKYFVSASVQFLCPRNQDLGWDNHWTRPVLGI